MISRERDVGISLSDRVRVRAHLLACRWCRNYLHQVDLIQGEMHRFGRKVGESAPQDVLDRLTEAVRKERPPST